MALGRLALKNMVQRVVVSSPSSVHQSLCERGVSATASERRWAASHLLSRISTAGATAAGGSGKPEVAATAPAHDGKSEGGKVAVLTHKKRRMFPERRRRRGFWRNNNSSDDDFVPALYEFFPSGLGDALLQSTQNIRKMLENLPPSRLVGQIKEQDDCYEVRYDLRGLGKGGDVKIIIDDDGILTIRGVHKEEDEEEEFDGDGYGCSYSNITSLVLPEDAKADEIKAWMNEGVLIVTIPRTMELRTSEKEC